jgi:hypothetical protein
MQTLTDHLMTYKDDPTPPTPPPLHPFIEETAHSDSPSTILAAILNASFPQVKEEEETTEVYPLDIGEIESFFQGTCFDTACWDLLTQDELLDFLSDKLTWPDEDYPESCVLSCIIVIFSAAAQHADFPQRSELLCTPLVRSLREWIRPAVAELDEMRVLAAIIGLQNRVFAQFLDVALSIGDTDFNDDHFFTVRGAIAVHLGSPAVGNQTFVDFLRAFVVRVSDWGFDAVEVPDGSTFDLGRCAASAILELATLSEYSIINDLIKRFPADLLALWFARAFEYAEPGDPTRIVKLFRRLTDGICVGISEELIIHLFVSLGVFLLEYLEDIDDPRDEDVWTIVEWFQDRGPWPEEPPAGAVWTLADHIGDVLRLFDPLQLELNEEEKEQLELNEEEEEQRECSHEGSFSDLGQRLDDFAMTFVLDLMSRAAEDEALRSEFNAGPPVDEVEEVDELA